MNNAPSFDNPWKRPPSASAKFLQERKTLERASRDQKPAPPPIQPTPDFSVYKPDPNDPVLSWEEEVAIPPISEYAYIPEARRPVSKGLRPSSINTRKALRFALGLHGLGIGSPIVKDAIAQQVERSYQRQVAEGEQHRERQNRENTRRARNILHQQWTESFTHPTSELPSGFYARNVLERNRIDFDEAHEEVIARRISEEAFPKYQEALQRFRSALRQEMESTEGERRLSIQQISRALRVATDGYTYLGGGSDQVGLLLLDKLGSCAQISIFVTLLLADAGFPREKIFLRIYRGDPNGHMAPTLEWEGQEYDLSSGGQAFPFGAKVPFRQMSQLSQEVLQLQPGSSLGGGRNTVGASSEVQPPDQDSSQATFGFLRTPTFLGAVPVDPAMDRPWVGDSLIPFRSGAITQIYEEGRKSGGQAQPREEPGAQTATDPWAEVARATLFSQVDPLFTRGVTGGELPMGNALSREIFDVIPQGDGAIAYANYREPLERVIGRLENEYYNPSLTTVQRIHVGGALLYAYEWAVMIYNSQRAVQAPILARERAEGLRQRLDEVLQTLSLEEQIHLFNQRSTLTKWTDMGSFWARFPERIHLVTSRALTLLDTYEDQHAAVLLLNMALHNRDLSGELRQQIFDRLTNEAARYNTLRDVYADVVLGTVPLSSFSNGPYARIHASAQALFSGDGLADVYRGYNRSIGERPEDIRYDPAVQRLARNIPTPIVRAFIRQLIAAGAPEESRAHFQRFISLLNGVISEREALGASSSAVPSW